MEKADNFSLSMYGKLILFCEGVMSDFKDLSITANSFQNDIRKFLNHLQLYGTHNEFYEKFYKQTNFYELKNGVGNKKIKLFSEDKFWNADDEEKLLYLHRQIKMIEQTYFADQIEELLHQFVHFFLPPFVDKNVFCSENKNLANFEEVSLEYLQEISDGLDCFSYADTISPTQKESLVYKRISSDIVSTIDFLGSHTQENIRLSLKNDLLVGQSPSDCFFENRSSFRCDETANLVIQNFVQTRDSSRFVDYLPHIIQISNFEEKNKANRRRFKYSLKPPQITTEKWEMFIGIQQKK